MTTGGDQVIGTTGFSYCSRSSFYSYLQGLAPGGYNGAGIGVAGAQAGTGGTSRPTREAGLLAAPPRLMYRLGPRARETLKGEMS